MNNLLDNPVPAFIGALIVLLAGFLLIAVAPQTIIFTGLALFLGKACMLVGGVFAVLTLILMKR